MRSPSPPPQINAHQHYSFSLCTSTSNIFHPPSSCWGLWSCRERESNGHTIPGKADQWAPRFSPAGQHREDGVALGPDAPLAHSAAPRAPCCPETRSASPSPAPRDTPAVPCTLQPGAATATEGGNHCNHHRQALALYLLIFLGLNSNLSNTQSFKTICNHVSETICNCVQVFVLNKRRKKQTPVADTKIKALMTCISLEFAGSASNQDVENLSKRET